MSISQGTCPPATLYSLSASQRLALCLSNEHVGFRHHALGVSANVCYVGSCLRMQHQELVKSWVQAPGEAEWVLIPHPSTVARQPELLALLSRQPCSSLSTYALHFLICKGSKSWFLEWEGTLNNYLIQPSAFKQKRHNYLPFTDKTPNWKVLLFLDQKNPLWFS